MRHRASIRTTKKVVSAACLLAASLCLPLSAWCSDPAPVTDEFLSGQDLSTLAQYGCDSPSRRLRIEQRFVTGSGNLCDFTLERGLVGGAGFDSRIIKAAANCQASTGLACDQEGAGFFVIDEEHSPSGNVTLGTFDADGSLLGPTHTVHATEDCDFPQYWFLIDAMTVGAVGTCRDSDQASRVSLR